MSAKQLRKRGFTLVEILIVVVILGILAAIVIPQFTNASESAKASSLTSQLQTIRSQIELYQVQHTGDYPDLINEGWVQLTERTNLDGSTEGGTVGTFDATATTFGPYLQQPSRNPFEDSTSVAAAAAADVGWVYDMTTGKIYAVMETSKAALVFPDKDDGDWTDDADLRVY
ncbi:MAG: prepilin-type N-terminal cleavage/methylation domain-containing protein [Phycisphaeraceae bacterium]|nr:prepilin-type N-terminal cleavage/methylation domain-containing protein [Phycisphaeraceae bacterium]